MAESDSGWICFKLVGLVVVIVDMLYSLLNIFTLTEPKSFSVNEAKAISFIGVDAINIVLGIILLYGIVANLLVLMLPWLLFFAFRLWLKLFLLGTGFAVVILVGLLVCLWIIAYFLYGELQEEKKESTAETNNENYIY